MSEPSTSSSMFHEKMAKSYVSKTTDKALVFQFGSFSYVNCECNMILYLTFEEMARHARGASKYVINDSNSIIIFFPLRLPSEDR